MAAFVEHEGCQDQLMKGNHEILQPAMNPPQSVHFKACCVMRQVSKMQLKLESEASRELLDSSSFSTVLSGLIYLLNRYSNLMVICDYCNRFPGSVVTLYPSIRPGWPSSPQAATSSIRRMMKWWQSWTKAIAISLVLNWYLRGFRFNVK